MDNSRQPAEKIQLSGEKETLLITLYAKAQESRLDDSLLHDDLALQAIERIDYDFSRLKVNRDMFIGLALRASLFDAWTRTFLSRYESPCVLNLGCGLDTRVHRVDPPAAVAWFDVDFPEVIALREKLYPTRSGYEMIGSSVTDSNWIERVPQGRPTLILAEGLFPYILERDVHQMLRALVERCEWGELCFDGYSRLGLKMLRHNPSVKATGAEFHWAIDDPAELTAAVPRLKFLEEAHSYDSDQIRRMSWWSGAIARLFARVPALRRIGRLLRYEFGNA